MNLVVRLVCIVTLVVLFYENGSALHIEVTNSLYKQNSDVKHEISQPIEYESKELVKSSGELELAHNEENEKTALIDKIEEVFIKDLETEEEAVADTSTNKKRIARQANGNLYPRLETYNGNQQYYPGPGQGMPINNSQWNKNPHYNPNSYNPLANITFNQYPSPSYTNSSYPAGYPGPGQGMLTNNSQSNKNPHYNSNPYNPLSNITFNQYPPPSYTNSQNNYYNNPGSPYHNSGTPYTTPTYNHYNSTRPSYGHDSSVYPKYPQNPYPSKHLDTSRNNTFSYGGSGEPYGNHNSGYPTPPPFSAVSPRPGYGYGNNNVTRPTGPHNPYQNTPRYSQYPTMNNNNYPQSTNSSYYGGPGQSYGNYNPNQRPVNPYGQNNSISIHSHGNSSRPYNPINALNTSNPYGSKNNNYNTPKYPNNNPVQQYGGYPGGYPSPPPVTNGGPGPYSGYPKSQNNGIPGPYGGYPTSQNNGQGPLNPASSYNPNSPYENPNLFNYPSKQNPTTNIYDPRKNPPHSFSY